MFKNLITTAYRSLMRNKSHAFLNLTGLTLGITCCLMIFLVVRYELSFDTFHSKSDRIFRITTQLFSEDNSFIGAAPYPVADAVKEEFPDVEQVTTIYFNDEGIIKANEQLFKESGLTYIAPSFFEIFDYEWLAGDPQKALIEPYTVVLTESVAKRYFGGNGFDVAEAALGHMIRLNDNADYKVTGIMKDFPENTDFPFKVLMSYATIKSLNGRELQDWASISSTVNHFVLLKEGSIATNVEAKFPTLIEKFVSVEESAKRAYLLQPLRELHFDERFGNFNLRTPTKASIISLSFIGSLLLLTACINFINLATAQSVKRSKEVGVRKVLGAGQGQLVRQFMTETLLLTTMGLGISILLTELFFPSIIRILNLQISVNWFSDPLIPLFLIVIILVVSVLAGFYPALVLSKFQPILALKNKINFQSSRGFSLRRGLIIFQFVVSQVLIIGTIVVAKQLDYFRNLPLGFNKEAIITISVPSNEINSVPSLRNKFQQIAGVESVSFGLFSPSSGSNWQGIFNFPGSGTDDKIVVMRPADPEYIKTFGLTLLAGRDLRENDSLRTAVVVNETLLRIMNVEDPQEAIGAKITTFGDETTIVGVVKDFYAFSLKEPLQPVLLFNDPGKVRMAALKITTGNIGGILANVEQAFKQQYPERIFEYQFLDESLAEFYQEEEKLSQLFTIFAGIAIFIGCLGLYGLISFIAAQKTKEIGVRKVLGASIINIVYLFTKEFFLLILLAFAIAAPLAWYVMQNWLQDFEYRIPLGPKIFLAAVGFTLLIAILTVGYRSIRAATANPVESLKVD